MTSLRQRITLIPESSSWLNRMASRYHYMRRPVHPRAHPFGWAIEFDGQRYQPDGLPSGFIMFATVHFTKLTGEFGYPGLPTKWQVLNLSRLWLHNDLPRNSETCAIAKAFKMIQRRWLEHHPPRFPEQPYHIVKIISYCDTRFHTGTIYRAANFRQGGRTTSSQRHGGSRGPGAGGELIWFMYDMKEPRWSYEPTMGLPLFDAEMKERTI